MKQKLAAIAALIMAAAACAQEPRPVETRAPTTALVNAQTALVAALECKRRGFRYMLRLSRDYVTCTRTAEGVTGAVAVDHVIGRVQ